MVWVLKFCLLVLFWAVVSVPVGGVEVMFFFFCVPLSVKYILEMAKQESVSEETILEELKARHFAPVYLLSGEEDYYIDLLSDYFEHHVIAPESQSFDQVVVYGRDVDMASVVGLASRFPMMSDYQLVLVKEAQSLGREGDKVDKAWEPLMAYLDNPSPQTILVFCFRHKKFDKRTKLYKRLKEVGVVYEHGKLYDNQVPAWIESYVSSKGYQITRKATLMLCEAIGADLSKLANELSKMFITVGQGGSITDTTVELNVGISKDFNVFELQNAIGTRDVVKCNRIVNYFADNPKNNPIQMVLPLIYSYIVKLMIYIQTPDKQEAASLMGVSPYFLRDYDVAARNFTLGKLATCIGYLYEADLRSKGVRNTGTITDGEILKELVFKIIH